jgi:hypothetical protein
MAKTLTADDILPLVASLTPQERVRLLHLIASSQGEDAAVYRSSTFSIRVFGGRGTAGVGRRGLGRCGVNRGEIRWYTFRLPDKRRF